ncbi:helix-turn-helix domain containing protein [Rhodoplanes sp. TEM]|uniref:Helix-turn-helix domain containing protein n=1 Tax=Rhodoplanes tepidamans TaxID=200616 RepID=A0ABT5JC99_RHOTP|nr:MULTISPECIES: TetR/AcrR family transcriptional regulator [Rhodoplanes]MDC7787232.1 helix-turn-helix domain containing protein [Rhodoplanes tepidamans]MDC7986577.1 helix-turn-helix domain containing protein [Rhodoplanes sp. TEM]MDQ0357766.1 AcrR family transcriptional regulator [Rhodoplanes tepidamans]
MHDRVPDREGLRERKRREMHERIAAIGLELFLTRGYEATTLDDIAAAVGISRRTFFHYFEGKDEILLAHSAQRQADLRQAVLARSTAELPIEVAQAALVTVAGRFDSARTLAIARLMRETKTLRPGRRSGFDDYEQVLFEALCELWPARERRERLRLVAVTAIGVLRLAVEAWLQDDARRPVARYIRAGFERLSEEMRPAAARAGRRAPKD